MGKNLKSDAVDHLFEAIMTLQNMDEYYAFFEDVCTVNELLSLSQRYEVASMLRQRKTYLDIAEKTGASTATVSIVRSTMAMTLTTWFLRDLILRMKNSKRHIKYTLVPYRNDWH